MRKLVLYVALLLCGTTLLTAGPVSPKKARAIAERFFSNSSLRSSGAIELTYTHLPKTSLRNGTVIEQPYYYVFNRGVSEGFAIVAGDDRMQEMLAYSENGHFDMSNAPNHVLWWMGQYDIQIEALLKSAWSLPALPTSSSASLRSGAVAPLLEKEQINWDQTHPYNSKCPKDPVSGARTPVGCVATAMGQIMRYHKWPEAAEGSHSYMDETYKDQGKAVERSATFGTKYDWANMPGKLPTSTTSEQRDALGQFLSDLGIAVNMQYSEQGSGSWEAHVVRALKENFKYKRNVRLVFRVQYELADWENLIRKELDANRPLFYSGAGTGGGHAFVCDGYNADGKFHFNWGWSGNANGYYALTALKPGVGGVGAGSLGDYSLSQGILLDVVPNKDSGTESADDFGPNISLRAKINANKQLEIKAALVHQGVDGAKVYFRPTLYKGDQVVKTGSLYVIDKMVLQELYTMNTTMDLTGVSDGEYTLVVEHSNQENGTYRKAEEVLDEPSRAKILIENGMPKVVGYNVVFTPLTVKSVKFGNNELKAFSRNNITLKIANNGDREFYAPIRLYAYDSEVVPSDSFVVHTPLSMVGSETLVFIPKGKEIEVTFSGHVGIKQGGEAVFFLQAPDLDPEDPGTDFGAYQYRLGHSHVRRIEGTFTVQPATGLMSPGLTTIEVENKDLVTLYTQIGLQAQGPKFKIKNFGRTHTTSTHGNVCGVIYAKHPPTGIYFVADISSNSYSGTIRNGDVIEFTPTFTGSREIANYTGYEGVMVIACMKRFGGNFGVGEATFGNVEVPVRFVKNTANGMVEPVLLNSVTPNPAKAECTISNDKEISSVDLFTLSGVKVRSFVGKGMETLTINVADLANGTYLVGVRSTDGSLQTHRLIVQH